MDTYKKSSLFLILIMMTARGFLMAGADPLIKVAAELANNLSRYPDKKIAVLSISYSNNRRSEASELVAEKLTLYLANNKRLSILDRHHILQILKELHLSETGLIDPPSAKKMGSVLGADILVTGTLIDLEGEKTEINVRGFMSENGRIVAASRALVDSSR